MSSILDRSFGRQAFGLDPHNYHVSRPPYPERVWTVLRERAGLRAGIDILEIGAGTGLATQHLLAAEPRRLVAVEPDARLAAFLEARLDGAGEVLNLPFEGAVLPEASFDLAVSATAFHWLDALPSLRRIHGLLRPGGHLALFWNNFGDHLRADAFHLATRHLFAGHKTSPSGGGTTDTPYGLDTVARVADMRETGFLPDEAVIMPWSLTLDPAGIRRLYSTYSNITALPLLERERVLDGLADVAERVFGGGVTRNMTTSLYTASRA